MGTLSSGVAVAAWKHRNPKLGHAIVGFLFGRVLVVLKLNFKDPNNSEIIQMEPNGSICIISSLSGSVHPYLYETVEFLLTDTGMVPAEVIHGVMQLPVGLLLLRGLQGAENQCSHGQIQHDP